MSDQPEQRPIEMSAGLPSTVLPEQPPALRAALEQALAADDPRAAVAAVVAANPRLLEGWATLGDLGRDVIERYAAYRVGYHRGLDTLRANGWRGSGLRALERSRQPRVPAVAARARPDGGGDRRG